MEKQPAKINYFFHDGYVEFGRTFVTAFKRCGKVIADSWFSVVRYMGNLVRNVINVIKLDSPVSSFFKAIGYAFVFGLAFGRLLLSAILTPLLVFLISAVQTVVLLIFMGMFYFLYCIIVILADWLYRSIKKISTSCPNCQEKYALPAFICTCGEKHSQLVPSKYGVLGRRCNCGRKLKTTFFNGRHKQPGKWVCPQCGYELGGPLQVDIPIPVVGGPSAGKTCYISMAIAQIEKNASANGLDFEYKPNLALGDDYEDNKRNMGNGRLPQKTNDRRMRYYQFYLAPHGKKVKNLISICDVAGEAYESNNEIGKQIGYKYANAFLMVVDPLSLRRYREEVERKISLSQYGASERGMDEVLDVLIKTLENMNCLTPKNMIKTDVAIVFTKCDIPGLADKIGESAVRRYMQLHDIRSPYEAANRVCEQFLIEYEEENFLNSLKSKFKSIQFFTCSALGHVENGSNFAPEGVEEPALWLIDKASASIDLKKKWGRKI